MGVMFGFLKRKKKTPERQGIPQDGGAAPEPRPAAHAVPAGSGTTAPAVQHDTSLIDLSGASVTVFGAGASGMAAARLLIREGAQVTVTDEREDRSQGPALPDGMEIRFGDPASALTGADLIVLSPGVPRRHPLVRAAEKAGTPVIGEVELAFRHLSCPVIGITGTNGKSTVTAMVGHVLKGWKPRVFTGGNLGEPLSAAAMDAAGWDVAVVELSSFQLEGITSLRPQVATVLNTSPDHMDRYDTVSDYYQAKFRIFSNMTGGFALVNAADESADMITSHYLPENVVPTRFNLPDTEGPDSDGVRITDGVISVTSGGRTHSVCKVSDLSVHGPQNAENAQAAAALCLLFGCPLNVIAERLPTFAGLPHRMQQVAQLNDVSWVNDSKATNPGAVVKAIEGQSRPIILLLGGRDKGGDLFTLREPIFLHTRKVILFGEAADKFRIVLQGYPDLVVTDTLEEAVAEAAGGAEPGDMVLLSPGCASFDEFENFGARGDAFRGYVEALA